MAVDTVVRARIDANTKARATAVLGAMGLTISDYLRMALVRLANDRAIPFAVVVPSPETRAAAAVEGAGIFGQGGRRPSTRT